MNNNSDSLGVAVPLVGATPKKDSSIHPEGDIAEQSNIYIAFTLNHPETKSFMNLNSFEQKIYYKKLMKKAMRLFRIGQPKKYRYTFEYTKKGKVHVHGYVYFTKRKYCIEGLVADLSKSFLRCVKQDYHANQFISNEYGVTYSGVFCHIDYIHNLIKWERYMNKCQ